MDCCEEKARSSPAWGIRLLDHIHRRAGSYAIADIPLQDPAQHMMLVNIDRIAMHGTLPSQRELAALLERLHALGYDGTISFECGPSTAAETAAALRLLRRTMEE